MPKEDVDLHRKCGVHISTTPSTDLQMSMGCPVPAYDEKYNGAATEICSLGVDRHSNNSAYLPGEARLALQSARGFRAQASRTMNKFHDAGKQTRSAGYTVEEAFNQATIHGARAAKMRDKIGSIAEGKLADLVIFDTISPAMVPGAKSHLVAAIVLYSSPADVETVIVNGIVRKRNRKLLPVELDHHGSPIAGGKDSVVWADVAAELLKSRAVLQTKFERLYFGKAEQGLMEAWHVDPARVTDPV